jgi:hypothetical protein
VSAAVDKSDQSHFGPGGADITVAVMRRGVGDSMAIRAIHGAGSALARTPQSDGVHLSLNNSDVSFTCVNETSSKLPDSFLEHSSPPKIFFIAAMGDPLRTIATVRCRADQQKFGMRLGSPLETRAYTQPISGSGERPIQEWDDVLHRARDVLFLFSHRRYVVHSTPGSLEPLEPRNDPAGKILRC